jgi:hypothetical protein
MEWLKRKLYGEEPTRSVVYSGAKAPDPRKGWLRKSALLRGHLWINTKTNRVHIWTGNTWRRLGVD